MVAIWVMLALIVIVEVAVGGTVANLRRQRDGRMSYRAAVTDWRRRRAIAAQSAYAGRHRAPVPA